MGWLAGWVLGLGCMWIELGWLVLSVVGGVHGSMHRPSDRQAPHSQLSRPSDPTPANSRWTLPDQAAAAAPAAAAAASALPLSGVGWSQ